MLNLALAAVLSVALAGILFGVRYMRRDAFLPYHAAVAGKSWAELDPGVQAVILGMLKIIGGGFVTLGVTLLWLCFSLHEGVRWAPWAILTISAAALGPMLYVATKLRAFRARRADARQADTGDDHSDCCRRWLVDPRAIMRTRRAGGGSGISAGPPAPIRGAG